MTALRLLVPLLVSMLGAARAQAQEPTPPSASALPPPAVPAASGSFRYAVVPAETTAFGLRAGKFVNELAGARFAFQWAPRAAFELGAFYANLRGKDGRVHDVLPEASLFYRLPLPGPALGLPVRFAAGYLPKNGPTLRLGLGLDCVVTERLVLELMLLEPMVWVTHDRPEVSLDVGAALRVGL